MVTSHIQLLFKLIESIKDVVGSVFIILAFIAILYYIVQKVIWFIKYQTEIFSYTPSIYVPITDAECLNHLEHGKFKSTASSSASSSSSTPDDNTQEDKFIPCTDPASFNTIGMMPAMTSKEVGEKIDLARVASKKWKNSSFEQRRYVLKILLKYILENQEKICRVSARDSGKAMVDASFAEVMCTCEKIRWLLSEGEQWLRPEVRSSGNVMFYKRATVEYIPYGVIGAIVPWNYPFHNLMNPIVTAIMSGNAIVVKVSEHTSWSSKYYGDIIRVAFSEAGCPCDLVQIITGYAEAGHAIASGNIDKLIFVGSTQIGRKVYAAAVNNLTPVTLELGGKDAVIICDDADINTAVNTCLRAAFQSAGANCCGGERFIVHEKIYEKFLSKILDIVCQMRQGKPLGRKEIDIGAICMPGLTEKIDELIKDATSKGAKLLTGGEILPELMGQFYAPTVISGVNNTMRIWTEEVFGPVMSIMKFNFDDEAVDIVNDCPFGLGASVFSNNISRAKNIASKLDVGMVSINDFGATYMCQSLPFGGIKESGFDRFAGIEGIRGMCYAKSVCEDRFPLVMTTKIPPMLQYPVKQNAFEFLIGLNYMFYGLNFSQRFNGLAKVIRTNVFPKKEAEKKKN